MEAKPPQRAFRASNLINNENVAPSAFGKNQRRQKAIGVPLFKDAANTNAPVKIPAKRTAFGDVSNVVRPLTESIVHGFKANAATNACKTGVVSAAPVSAPPMPVPPVAAHRKDAGVPAAPMSVAPSVAPFLAPPQRPQSGMDALASIPAAPEPVVKTHAGVARRATVVFRDNSNNAVESSHVQPISGFHPEAATIDDADTATGHWNKLKRSPRQSKSQPCLKNAGGLLQQPSKPLRRTMSRLVVDMQDPMDDTVSSTDANERRVAASIAAVERKTDNVPSTHVLDGLYDDVLDIHDLGDANDADFVDAVEDLENVIVPPQEAAAVMADEPRPLAIIEQAQKTQPPCVPQPAKHAAEDFLTEAPSATVASCMSEMEEPWDDDADFYDDQAYTTAHSFRSLGDNTTGSLTTVLMPKMTAKIQNELELAKALVEASADPDDLDDEAWDISMVAEYGEEIYGYMRELEIKMLPNPYYMDIQTEIQWSMRAVLMEWLVQVHSRFNLLPETLFLTVNYIDRFLSSKIVSVAKLQLVGATAIFIAAKYEEIICPSIQEIVYMVDGGYTTDEILKAERFMLSMLGFELGWPGPMSFLRRISKADDYDLDTRTLAKYFLEVTIMDERFVACPPSFLAAGAHCLARLMLSKGDWSTAHTHYSGYTWSQVRPLASTILHCCRDPTTHHAAVYEKYAGGKFKKAAIYVEEEMRRGFSMPPIVPYHQNRHRLSFMDALDCTDELGVALRSKRPDVLINTES